MSKASPCANCPFRRNGSKGMSSSQIQQAVLSFRKDKPFPCKGGNSVCLGSLNFAFNIYGIGVYAQAHVRSAEENAKIWRSPNPVYASLFYCSIGDMIQGHQS